MIRICSLFLLLTGSSAFLATNKAISRDHYISSSEIYLSFKKTHHRSGVKCRLFDKIFEEEGMLGKGITVGKVQVALRSSDRSDASIFGLLEDHASLDSKDNEDLSRMANGVCLDLMRKTDDWVSAASTSQWFSEKDAGKAESYYNELANAEATKFEKEYLPDKDEKERGGPTLVVVSLVLEIQGDSTK